MRKIFFAMIVAMTVTLFFGCQTQTVQTKQAKPDELIPIVNIENLTERESAFNEAKPYTNDGLIKGISAVTKKVSVFTSADNSSLLLIALQFDKDTPQEDVSAFKEAINSLSDAVVNSGYKMCQFFLISDGDIRMQTAPLSVSSGGLETASAFFNYSGKSEVDTQYANAVNQ
jgi:hypothetical protein